MSAELMDAEGDRPLTLGPYAVRANTAEAAAFRRETG